MPDCLWTDREVTNEHSTTLHCIPDRIASRVGDSHPMGRIRLNYHPALGGVRIGGHMVYAPWSMFIWARDFGDNIPKTLNEGYAFIGGTFILATLMLVGAPPVAPQHPRPGARQGSLGQQTRHETRRSIDWPGNRSRTCLWSISHLRRPRTPACFRCQPIRQRRRPRHPHAAELERQRPGLRHQERIVGRDGGDARRRGYCLFFNPTRPDSARFNPLFEIRKGDNEMRDTQNIVEMLVNPTGAKHTMDIWDQQASQFLVALILHVLYTEPDQY